MGDGEGSESGDEQPGVPWGSRTVQVVLASTALAPLGVPLISPTLPTIRGAFAVTDAQASLFISAYFATGIVLSPFIGILADRFGCRQVLLVSLFGFGIAGGAVAFAALAAITGYRTLLLVAGGDGVRRRTVNQPAKRSPRNC